MTGLDEGTSENHFALKRGRQAYYKDGTAMLRIRSAQMADIEGHVGALRTGDTLDDRSSGALWHRRPRYIPDEIMAERRKSRLQ